MRLPALLFTVLTHLFVLSSIANAAEFPTPANTEKANTAPMDPAEVCKTAKLPPGFKLSVFAAEPDVQNPIAITTDERGRLWVAENYSWAGADGFSAQQRDRIVILEDTDGDGKYDRRVVFFDEAHKLTSIEVGFGGVWAICLPHVVFIPDKDRDDVPDGPPVVVLDGLLENNIAHTPANGLKWGPDGWLYARHGILGTSHIGKPGSSDSQRVSINTGVWRFHPTRGTVEVVMEGMTNSWGFDFDAHGEMFVINTVIGHLWHVLPGAHVKRMFGLDLNPHVYQLIDQTADHVHWDTGEAWDDIRKGVTDKTSAAGGGHAHSGLMIYQGDNWPEEYRGRVYTLNLHGRRINSDNLVRVGAGYQASHGPDLCFIADPWFRGMDLISGPDGGVFIADWSDTGECHDIDGVHRTSGRIYKLTYGKPQNVKPFDLATMTDQALVQFLLHPNCWWQRQAQRILSERALEGDTRQSPVALVRTQLLRLFDDQVEIAPRLRILQALCTTSSVSDEWLMERCAAPNEFERASALKFLVDRFPGHDETLPKRALELLQRMAERDSSGLVLLHLASALQRMPYDQRWPIARKLAARKEFAKDQVLPLMLWYGIELAVPRNPSHAVELARRSQVPLVTQNISRRLTLEIEHDPSTVEKLLDSVIKNEIAHPEEILVGMSLALHGWRKAPCPANWSQVVDVFRKASDDKLRQLVRDLGVVFGDGLAIGELRQIVTDAAADPEARRQALRALLSSKPTNFVSTLFGLLRDPALASEAIRGLAQYDEPVIPPQILGNLDAFDAAARKETIIALASRPSYARALLAAIRDRRISAGEIPAFYARQIRSFGDADLTAELIELWGNVGVSAGEKRSQIELLKSSLTRESLAKANLPAGRATFQKTCANCHVLFGVGRKLGPDLTGSNRQNIDYLLENIVDPSATLGIDFRASVVELLDGRVLSGVISGQNEQTLTLETANESVTIDKNDVEQVQPTVNSPMPDGLLQNLSAEEVRDLVGYLMSANQTPLPNVGGVEK